MLISTLMPKPVKTLFGYEIGSAIIDAMCEMTFYLQDKERNLFGVNNFVEILEQYSNENDLEKMKTAFNSGYSYHVLDKTHKFYHAVACALGNPPINYNISLFEKDEERLNPPVLNYPLINEKMLEIRNDFKSFSEGGKIEKERAEYLRDFCSELSSQINNIVDPSELEIYY